MKPTRITEDSMKMGNSATRIQFNVPDFFSLIDDMGMSVLWEKSYLCTCRNPITKAPDPTCPICMGRGIAYLPSKKVKVAIQSQDRSVTNADLGLYDSGTAIATTLPESTISFRDRLSLPDVKIQQSLLFDVTDKRVRDGMWLSYDVDEIALAVTDNGKMIYENEDYTFNKEKNLFIPKEHLLGKNVSLNITTVLRYIVIDLLKESRYQYTNKGTQLEKFESLPKKLLLKREDAWVNPTPFSMETEGIENQEAMEDPKRNMSTNSGGFFGGVLNGK